MPASLDKDILISAMSLFEAGLERHREELDAINVFPVADADTGENLLQTQRAVVGRLRSLEPSAGMALVLETIADASLLGARGNSGVILSQVLRGLCRALPAEGESSPPAVASALSAASTEAYRAVQRPVEGTILTVLREAAAAADAAAAAGGSLPGVVEAALAAGRAALAETRRALPELAAAGVVDAGGKGVVLLLDALRAAVTGTGLSEPTEPATREPRPVARQDEPARGPAFEVQYLLRTGDEGAVDGMRGRLDEVGESLVVVGGGGSFRVHVHTDLPDAAVDAGRAAGQVGDVSVVSLGTASTEPGGEQARGISASEAACGLVAVGSAAGVLDALGSLGAVVGSEDEMSAGRLEPLIERAVGREVVVLTWADDAALPPIPTGGGAEVVVCRSAAAAIAAAAAFSPDRDLDSNVRAMSAAARACRSGSLRRSAAGDTTCAGAVRPGGWIGAIDGEVLAAGGDVLTVAADLLAAAVPPFDLVTLIWGRGATSPEAARLADRLRERPDTQVQVIRGDQADPPYLLGIE